MANYYEVTRTNYFRVTDEDKYQELFQMLTSEDNIEDFTKEDSDGVIYHGFGAYSSIEYFDEESDEYNLDKWFYQLQTILPDDEAFIMQSSGHEKLRCVDGWVDVVTNKEISSMSCSSWATQKAKELLGNDFTTQITR